MQDGNLENITFLGPSKDWVWASKDLKLILAFASSGTLCFINEIGQVICKNQKGFDFLKRLKLSFRCKQLVLIEQRQENSAVEKSQVP